MELLPNHDNIGSLVPVTGEEQNDKNTLALKMEIDKDLTKFVNELFDKCKKLNKPEWSSVKRNMIKSRKYFDGQQWGFVDDNFQWQDYPTRPGEVNYTDNTYQPHLLTAQMEISRGATELSFSYISDSRKGQMVVRVAEQRYKTHKQRLFDKLKMAQEELSLLLNGIGLRYSYFKHNQSTGAPIPKFGESDVEMDDAAEVCATCGTPRKEDEFAANEKAHEQSESGLEEQTEEKSESSECPHCGDTETERVESKSYQTKAINGYEPSSCGENDWVSVDPLGVTFYLHAPTLRESPFILWSQAVLSEILQAAYPETEIGKEGITSQELRDKYDADSKTPNAGSYLRSLMSDSTKGDITEFEQGWFDPDLYKNYVLKSDVKLKSGISIPKGTRLGEAFPHGLYVARNGKRILDLWNESKNDKWTAVPYVARLGTLVGAGTSVALSNQDTKNDLRNLQMNSVFNDSFRKEFVNAQYLEGENVPNSPTERAIVTNLPEGARILGTVIDALPPSPLSPDAYQMEERIDVSMQMQLGTFSGTAGGSPDLKAVQDTAAGFLAWRNMTVGRYSPMLSARADALDKEQAYQFLINDQKFLSPEQWGEIAGDYGGEAVKFFLADDLRKNLIIEVVGETYMPSTSNDRQAGLMAFSQWMVQTQTPPDSELGAYGAKQFHIPGNIVGFEAHYNIAEATIQKFKEIADEIAENLGDIPTFDIRNDQTAFQLAQLVISESDAEIDAEMDNHEAMIDAYKDWWATDAGRNATNVLKATITARVEQHKNAMVTREQQTQELAMQAQAPMMEEQQRQQAEQMAAQQQMEQQSGQAQNAQASEQQNAQMQTQQMQNQHEAETGEAERAHEMNVKGAEMAENERQRQHEMEMQKNQPKAA